MRSERSRKCEENGTIRHKRRAVTKVGPAYLEFPAKAPSGWHEGGQPAAPVIKRASVGGVYSSPLRMVAMPQRTTTAGSLTRARMFPIPAAEAVSSKFSSTPAGSGPPPACPNTGPSCRAEQAAAVGVGPRGQSASAGVREKSPPFASQIPPIASTASTTATCLHPAAPLPPS